MVRAHRQAWTWQDEWFNLTMEDIRELERQTQEALAKKMGSAASSTGNDGSLEPESNKPTAALSVTSPSSNIPAQATGQPIISPSNTSANLWPISYISESSSDDDEFFDCEELRSTGALSPAMVRWSSMELMPQGEDGEDFMEPEGKAEEALKAEEKDSIFSPGYLQRYATANRWPPPQQRKPPVSARMSPGRSLSPASSSSSSSAPVHPANALILVFHGGTVLDPSSPEATASKAADLATFCSSLDVSFWERALDREWNVRFIDRKANGREDPPLSQRSSGGGVDQDDCQGLSDDGDVPPSQMASVVVVDSKVPSEGWVQP